jgi:1,4-alpha-glucan branching enzyme
VFSPTLGDVDLHLFNEGTHRRLWEVLGSHVREHEGVAGTSFAVWAPNARAVRAVGDWNFWDGRVNPMRPVGSSGVWEVFVPGIGAGTRYKYEIEGADGSLKLRADPFARQAEIPPATASVVSAPGHDWGDEAWMAARRGSNPFDRPLRIYEVHAGSWRPGLSYRELAHQLGDYLVEQGFTHAEFLPLASHPFAPSWGYQAPATSRRPAASARPTTSATSSTTCTSAASG